MPMLGGSSEPWPFSCSLNLASCRQRAETLARQLHANLWSPRSSFSSDGGSRSVSPSFGFGSPVILQPLVGPSLLGKPLKDHGRMSSLDDDEEENDGEEDAFCLDQTSSRSSEVDIVVTPPSVNSATGLMSPPKSPSQMTPSDPDIPPLPRNGEDFYVNFRGETRLWMPDSPPESFGSESLQSDSPALTVETEEHSATPSSSTETVSEVASPTADDLSVEKGTALAHELCSRLKQFENLQINGRSVFSPQDEELIANDEPSSLTNVSDANDESSKSDCSSSLLSPIEPCPRLIRSTSLKTGKTPPDTPNRKKIVRFADALGLDLEAVRHFVEDEDFPLVPQSAFADLKIPPSVSLPWASLPGQTVTNCQFLPQFKQPAANPHFLDKVRMQKVCLENLMVNDLRITAVIRVLNLGYQKQVIARYTTTEWAAHTDLVADYAPRSCDGFSDKFTFTLHLPHLCTGQRLAFALKYIANGQEFWDNNSGQNYVLRVQTKLQEAEAVGTGPRWSHHFI